MGRRSGYDRSGLPLGASGAARNDQTPTQQNHNLQAAPATQGAQSSSITDTQPQGITGSGWRSQTSILTSEYAQSIRPATGTHNLMNVQSQGFVPAHPPGPDIAAADIDSAREYGGVVSGRLQQQPQVPEGRSGLRNEVRRLDGPTDLPSVRAVPRHTTGSRGLTSATQTQQSNRMAAPMPLSTSVGASGVTNQGPSLWKHTFLRAEYARCNPQSPLPTSQEQLDDLARELEAKMAGRAADVSATQGTGTYLSIVYRIICLHQMPLYQSYSC